MRYVAIFTKKNVWMFCVMKFKIILDFGQISWLVCTTLLNHIIRDVGTGVGGGAAGLS